MNAYNFTERVRHTLARAREHTVSKQFTTAREAKRFLNEQDSV